MTLFCRVRDEPGGMCALQLERSKGRRPALHLPSVGTFYQSQKTAQLGKAPDTHMLLGAQHYVLTSLCSLSQIPEPAASLVCTGWLHQSSYMLDVDTALEMLACQSSYRCLKLPTRASNRSLVSRFVKCRVKPEVTFPGFPLLSLSFTTASPAACTS